MNTNNTMTIDTTGGFSSYPYWSVIPPCSPVQYVPYPVWMVAPAVAACEHCYCKDDGDQHFRCCKCIDRKHEKFLPKEAV